MSEHISTRHCIVCQKIIRGRSDKKFCNDNCRNQFNNAHKPSSNSCVKGINQALFRNRNILESLLPPSTPAIKQSREKLLEKGFQFRYFTHQLSNTSGKGYVFCYDFGYQVVGEDDCIIIRQDTNEQPAII